MAFGAMASISNVMPMSYTSTNRARAPGGARGGFSNVQPTSYRMSNVTESLDLFDDFAGGYNNANVMDAYQEKKLKGKVAFEEI